METADDVPTAEEQQQQYVWSAFYDDEGRLYYYNSVTEESSWDPPPDQAFNPPPPVEGPPGDTTQEEQELTKEEEEEEREEQDEAGTPTASPTAFVDEDDVDETDEKEEAPSSTKEEAPVADAGAWVAYQDDEGREYYHNTVTGETQWDKPEGYIASAAEAEGPPADEPHTDPEPAAEETETEVVHQAAAEPTADPPDEPMTEDDNAAGEQVDPLVRRIQEAEQALNQPDSILEPGCIDYVTDLVTAEGGNPQKAVSALIDNYQGQSAVCGLLGLWLADLRATATLGPGQQDRQVPSEGSADAVREIVQDVIVRIAKERFTKEAGDSILELSKSQAVFLGEMMDSSRWRKLLIDLSASHKDSAMLMYCLRAISKKGHHREIARRVNQSEHFAVFNAMLSSELSAMGKLAVAAGCDPEASVDLDDLVDDLLRACSSTSYTYLYSLQLLRFLESKAREEMIQTSLSSRVFRAIRKWEAISQNLESWLMDPSLSASVAGSSPLFRKRRLDMALTISELHQRQRRHKRGRKDRQANGHDPKIDASETALLTFLRRHAVGTQLDDAALDPLLPSGLDSVDPELIGRLLLKYPLAIRALLGHLFKGGAVRVSAPTLRNKCARLIALSVLASEKIAAEEAIDVEASPALSDEVEVTRSVLQGSQLCEQLESVVSFVVTASEVPPEIAIMPGQKLCQLAMKSAPVAQGVMIWAKDLTCVPEFAASASFPTLSGSIMSLLRLVALQQPFTRRDAIYIALSFLGYSNSEVSYQKISSIREQALRLLLSLFVKGEVVTVLRGFAHRLGQAPELDASLIRYFVAGLLDVIRPPISLVFVISMGTMLKVPKCIDAVRSSYFGEANRAKLSQFLVSATELCQSANGMNVDDDIISMVAHLVSTYQNESK